MSEKAVISAGGKQYIVSKGDELEVDLIKSDKKKIELEPLMLISEGKVQIGTPSVKGAKVSAEIIGETKGEKTVAIRYKAKKRVRKVRGHRQTYSRIKISSIAK